MHLSCRNKQEIDFLHASVASFNMESLCIPSLNRVLHVLPNYLDCHNPEFLLSRVELNCCVQILNNHTITTCIVEGNSESLIGNLHQIKKSHGSCSIGEHNIHLLLSYVCIDSPLWNSDQCNRHKKTLRT